MKPHHRTSLLLGCLGLFVLYLPDGVSLVGRWPSRPDLGAVPALKVLPVATLSAVQAGDLAMPVPKGPAAPLTLDDLSIGQSGDTYMGGQ